MKKNKFMMATIVAMGCAGGGMLASCSSANERTNPLLSEYNTPFEIPPFDQIEVADYMPALSEAINQQKAEIEAIINNPEAPNFDNTIYALDKSGELINRVALLFSGLDEAMSSPELVEVAEQFYPELQKWGDEIAMNPELFARIKTVYDNREQMGLNTAQMRMVEESYRDAVRSGALLNAEDQEKLKAINSKLTDLYLQFNKNLLSATNDFSIVIDDEKRLEGLPQGVIDAAALTASERNLPEGNYVFTLHGPSRLPVLQYAADRSLRQQMYEGYTNLASSGQYDNSAVINEIVKARTQKARILGYPDFASYATANVMAQTPEAAMNLLNEVWTAARTRVIEEVKEMQALTSEKIMPWDYNYYAEKLRQSKYDLNEDELRQYFAADSVVNGVFQMAKILYGVDFKEISDAPKYHPEVKVYDVTDSKTGEHIAVFMTDFYPRASKRQGAWMSEFKGSYIDDNGQRVAPIIYNVGNFTAPTANTPALLSIDDVETLFHEFGHGLHGMLTRAKYRGQAGTNVDRDFVELPSQIHEHWAVDPEMLKMYAHHWQTGEVIPDELIEKLRASLNHNQGFTTGELSSAALLDLYWGKLNLEEDQTIDVMEFERNVAKELGMPAELQFRYRSPYFKHVFGSDGYASGYYTYLWAEVLDSDGFELFEERGIFDPETAASFKKNILEAGGSEDPMTLYVNFRGRKPAVDALLRNRGLK